MICNNANNPKNIKPSQFIDLPIQKLYLWKNTTIKIPSFITLQENETRYNATNGTYQVTVPHAYNTFINQIVPGWENVPLKMKKNNKNTYKPIDPINFQPDECKTFTYKYANVLQSIGSQPYKYDLGDDDTVILDPIVNSTDYTFNATLDSNNSLTSANIVSAFNVSRTSNGTAYVNDSRLISMWEFEDTSASATVTDTTGRNVLTIYNPTNFTKGIPGYFNKGVLSNGTNNSLGGYACLTPIPEYGDAGSFSLDFWINTTGTSHLQTQVISIPHLYVSIVTSASNGSGQLNFFPRVDNCLIGGVCSSVRTTTNFTTNANLNKWIHTGYTFNGTYGQLQVNGILENTSSGNFSLTTGTLNVLLFGGTDGGACANGQTCTPTQGPCFSGMIDEVRWWNASITDFQLNQSKYYSNIIAVNNNVTRFRVTTSSLNPSLVNTSFSLDGSTNRVENITTGNTYNWTFGTKNLFAEYTDLLGIVDYYGSNVTFGNTHFTQNINNRNISHSATLNISLNATDDLTPIIPITWDNNGTNLFTINPSTGEINANFSIAQSGTYQIRVNATINNVTAYEIFNLTIFDSAYNTTSVTITPAIPGPEVNMYCNVFGNDNENDQIVQGCSQYNWYRNNGLEINHEPNISGSYSLGDDFICETIICDGLLNNTATNSTAVTITQGGGGGGGPPPPPAPSLCPNSVCDTGENSDNCQQDCPSDANDANLPPTIIPPFNNPPIVPGDVVIQNIINNIPNNVTSHFCGDTVCDPDEHTQNCPRDCTTNLDPYFNQALFSIKCFGLKIFFFELPSYCDEESLPFINWLLILLAIITAYFLWIYFDRERKKKKKSKKRKRRR